MFLALNQMIQRSPIGDAFCCFSVRVSSSYSCFPEELCKYLYILIPIKAGLKLPALNGLSSVSSVKIKCPWLNSGYPVLTSQ